MSDVEHLDSLASLEDAIDDAIDMRFVSVKKVLLAASRIH